MVIRRPQNDFGFTKHKSLFFTLTLTTPYFGHQTLYSEPTVRYKFAANSQINTKPVTTVWAERAVVEC